METIDKRTVKEKIDQGWAKFTTGVTNKVAWIKEHPKEAVMIGTFVLAGVSEGRRVYDRAHQAHEDHINRTSVYCNDIQGKVRLKHELNYRENRELRDRMSEGQTKFEALDDMGLLRR